MRASLTSRFPSSTSASAIICLPAVSLIMSSMTMSSALISLSTPSLTTMHLLSDIMDSLSMILFEANSSAMLIMVLPMAISTNVQFFSPLKRSPATIPATITAIPSTRLRMLKYVKKLSAIILPTDLVLLVLSLLT